MTDAVVDDDGDDDADDDGDDDDDDDGDDDDDDASFSGLITATAEGISPPPVRGAPDQRAPLPFDRAWGQVSLGAVSAGPYTSLLPPPSAGWQGEGTHNRSLIQAESLTWPRHSHDA